MPTYSGMIIDPGDKNAKKSYPKLKAKAYETKMCLFAFKHVWQNRMDSSNESHQWINIALKNALQIDELCPKHADTWKLPLDDSNLLVDSCNKFLTCNHALHKFFANSGRCLFKCDTFKHHWLVHAVRLNQFINPLHLSCYRGESFMHTMKTLMHSQLVSRKPSSSMTSFMPRYCLALTYETVNANAKKKWKVA